MKLIFFNEEFSEGLNAFSLDEEQHQFTALPKEALEVKDEGRYPVVFIVEETPVGFFVLHKGKQIRDYSENPNAILLRAFSINKIHQGKGYAKQAMKQLPAFTAKHFPEIEEIVLAVNERNEVASSLYIKSGFADRGVKLLGRKGWQLILFYEMK